MMLMIHLIDIYFPHTIRLAILDKAGCCYRWTHWRHCLHVHSVQGIFASLPPLEGTQQASSPTRESCMGLGMYTLQRIMYELIDCKSLNSRL